MAIKVGTLQVDLIAGTASFTGPLDKAGQQAKKSAQDIQDGFNKMDLTEARGAVALLGEEIGVHLPRHVQTFIAEIPGVGSALKSAFSTVAVVAIGAALIEGATKLIEYRDKQEQVRVKAEEIGNSWIESSQKIQQEIDTQEAKIVAFNQGPVAGMAFAFEHSASEAIKHIKDIETEITQAAGMITASGNVFTNWVTGSDAASTDLKKFSADLAQTMLTAESGSDHFASLNAGLKMATEKSASLQQNIDDLDKKLGKRAQFDNQVESLKSEQAAVDDTIKKFLQLSNLQSTTDQVKKNDTSQANFGQTKDTAGLDLQKRLADIAQEKSATIEFYTALGESLDEAKAKADAIYGSAELQAHLAYYDKLAKAGGSALDQQRVAAERQIFINQEVAKSNNDLAATENKNTELTAALHNILFNEAKDQQKQQSAAAKQAIDDIDKKNKVMVQEAEAFQSLGNKKIEAIDKEIAALNLLIASSKLNESTTVKAYDRIHSLEQQRQKDLNDEMIASGRLGQVMKGTLGNMAMDFSNWQQKVGQVFQQTINGMNTSLANFLVTGEGGWRNLAVSALTSLAKIEIEHIEAFALQKTLASQQQLLHAKSAFWSAYDATSAIPIVGPALAPAAGAAAFAAVMAFEQGGIVPRDALSLVHREEMVLPRPISTFIMNAATNAATAGSSSSSAGSGNGAMQHFVFAPTVHAVDSDGVDRMLTKHADTFHRHVKKQLRRMHLNA